MSCSRCWTAPEAREALRDIIPAMENVLSDGAAEKQIAENIDYKEKYFALKKKYDKLLKYVRAWSILLKKHKT